MAADYWASTQHLHWEHTSLSGASGPWADEARPDINELKARFPLPEPRLINTYIQQQLSKLGKRLNTRQLVLATALVFIRRLYTTIDIRETNPYLVLTTAFYLACKIEECPQHIKVVVSEARTLWADFIPTDTSKLGECEFYLISKINAQLIVHHPYRSLTELQKILGLTPDEMALAWSTVNDHYVTDLPLQYPPHMIATAAVVLTVVVRPSGQSTQQGQGPNSQARLSHGDGQASSGSAVQTAQGKSERLNEWLAESGMDIQGLIDCTQQLISLYVLWEQYSDKDCKDKIANFVKALGLNR